MSLPTRDMYTIDKDKKSGIESIPSNEVYISYEVSPSVASYRVLTPIYHYIIN